MDWKPHGLEQQVICDLMSHLRISTSFHKHFRSHFPHPKVICSNKTAAMTLPLFSGLLMTRDNSLLLNIFITEINPVKLDDLPISVHIHWLMMFQK